MILGRSGKSKQQGQSHDWPCFFVNRPTSKILIATLLPEVNDAWQEQGVGDATDLSLKKRTITKNDRPFSA
jgi:hypothetical protein